MLKQYVGDRKLYRRLFALMIPIMVQNGITNFVSMLDNIMIGRLGTAEMTGVAVVNQLMFVFNLCVFGAVSGAGIFGAQFFGKGDNEGIRHTFRFKILFSVALTIACIVVFILFGDNLINMYLQGEGSAQSAIASLGFAKKYLWIMLIGMVPYAITQSYSSTLRETGQAVIPMNAGFIAVLVNLCFNYVLIYGAFGAPALGVSGAAVATVIARFTELLIIAVWTRANRNQNPFIVGVFKSMYIPKKLITDILIKGTPLMLNETLWAAGIAMISQCYSIRGLGVVAAANITDTFANVFSIVYVSGGATIGIILGQILGAGELERAKSDSKKLIAFCVAMNIVIGAVFAVAAEFIPMMYNTEPQVRYMATRMMQISALGMPFAAFTNACYFTLRSGGKVAITLVFDSCFMWVINVPLVFILSRYTALHILALAAVSQSMNVIKSILGGWFVGSGMWIRNIVAKE